MRNFKKILSVILSFAMLLSCVFVGSVYTAAESTVLTKIVNTYDDEGVEFTSFVGMRVLSLGMDMAGMALMVSLLHWNDALSKVLIQVIVVLSNYVFSKLFVFKKKD